MKLSEAAAIIGVPVDASKSEARKAYLSRARLLHPDRFAGSSSEDVAAATAAMAQLNHANEVFQSGASDDWNEQEEDEFTPPSSSTSSSSTWSSSSSGAWSDASTACDMCGWGPATQVKFNTVVGLIIFWRWSTLDAKLCRGCGEAAYNDSQGSTLLKGWWGIIAPFANLIAFFLNLSRVVQVRALSRPVGRYLGANTLLMHPLPPVTPWYKRPASVVASIAALSIVGLVIAALLVPAASSSISSEPTLTTCIKGGNVEESCAPGTTWTYSYCYNLDPSAPTPSLLRYESDKWVPVDLEPIGLVWNGSRRVLAPSNFGECPDEYPYLVKFVGSQTELGAVTYRVSTGTFYDDFTATVTADRN